MNDVDSPSRRRALICIGSALVPTAAVAQSAEPGFNQVSAPATTTPVPAPTAAAPKALGPIDKGRHYVLFFQQTIDLNSAKLLRNNLATLTEEGMTDATLVVNSSGGLVAQALQLFSLIQSLPMKVVTHAQGAVQSAANILFLAGTDRAADPTATFTIHPAQGGLFGFLNIEQVEKEMKKIKDVQDQIDAIYRQRTKIPERLIQEGRQREVVIDAQHAQEYGIIARIGEVRLPSDRKVKLVFPD